MDNLLCDELLQEIFTRITKISSSSQSSSSFSSASVSLVSKRWLHIYRTSRTSLSLRLNPDDHSKIQTLSSLLANYPFLSSLSLVFSSDSTSAAAGDFNDDLVFIVSTYCSKLKHLRFLTGPVSCSCLVSLSNSCTLLTSLSILVSRPVFLNWVAFFSCLKELSIAISSIDGVENVFRPSGSFSNQEIDAELGLESLFISGIKRDDFGFGWLWRSCKKLKKLQLKCCEGVGDGGSFVSFISCLKGIQEMELRTCRSISHGVLLRLAENSDSLISLLIYDGGTKDGLLHFVTNCRCNLRKLDLRLPLDLNNDHLFAISMKFRALSSLRLQSCCLVTGEGLKALGVALSSVLEELALVNCDVVERESGLLATLGQNLRQLRKLDLSHNEFLPEKEIISMLVSCNSLVELKLRGCRRVTSLTLMCLLKNCKRLECVDILHCVGIEFEAVELFFLNSIRLRFIQVEENKVSDVAKKWAHHKFIEVAYR